MSLNYAENVNSFGTLGGWPISESNLRPMGIRNGVVPKPLIGQSVAIFLNYIRKFKDIVYKICCVMSTLCLSSML